MTANRNICAVVPVKDTTAAKQRLAGLLPAAQRRELALAMCEDVLTTLSTVSELAGIVVVTVDPAAAALAGRYGARVWQDGASDGHTGAVTAAAGRLARERFNMLALPGDIPLLRSDDVRALLAADAPFAITPARDDLGSNAVLCAPPEVVPLRFGENSFFPHLAAAQARGIAPKVLRLPRISLDIDTPEDLALFLATPSRTRARALLDAWHIGAALDVGRMDMGASA
jgi:2-phospho-L-lactate guanylyltransferase